MVWAGSYLCSRFHCCFERFEGPNECCSSKYCANPKVQVHDHDFCGCFEQNCVCWIRYPLHADSDLTYDQFSVFWIHRFLLYSSFSFNNESLQRLGYSQRYKRIISRSSLITSPIRIHATISIHLNICILLFIFWSSCKHMLRKGGNIYNYDENTKINLRWILTWAISHINSVHTALKICNHN